MLFYCHYVNLLLSHFFLFHSSSFPSVSPSISPLQKFAIKALGWSVCLHDAVCRSIWISAQRQLGLGVGGLLYLTLFHPRMTHSSLDSLILISLYSLCARLSLFDSLRLAGFCERLLFLLKPPTAETKAKRRSALHGRHTDTHEKTSHLRTSAQKPTPRQNPTSKSLNTRTAASTETQSKGFSGRLKDFYSFRSFNRQQFP